MVSDAWLLPLYLIAGLVLIAFIGSFLWSAIAFKGRARTVVLTVVVFFWAGFYWYTHGRSASRYKWERDADAICAAEADNALESQDIDSLVDENTVLTPDSVLFLLSQNNLKSVEVRVGKSTDRNDGSTFGHDHSWKKSDVEKLYAKLELSKNGDPACIALPHDAAGHESHIPFLPDTCVKASFLHEPSSRYSLEFAPAHYSDWPFMSKYGAWSIIDRQTNKTLATATTYLASQNPIKLHKPEELLKYGLEFHADRRQCVFGSGLIAQVRSNQRPSLDERRYLKVVRLAPQYPAFALDDSGSPQIPVVRPRKVVKEYSTGRANELAQPGNSTTSWNNAVTSAQQLGWSSFASSGENYVIHWNTKEVIALEKPPSTAEFSWRVFSLGDGFIALSIRQLGRATKLSGIVMRYASDGTLSWNGQIGSPQNWIGRCTTIEPSAVYVDGADLMLTTACAEYEKGTERRELWSIPLSDLPGPL